MELRGQVWCDHKPLMHLMDQPHLTAKQARWIHRIAPYLPFKFVYVPGSSAAMGVADALSRKVERLGGALVASELVVEGDDLRRRFSCQRSGCLMGGYFVAHRCNTKVAR